MHTISSAQHLCYKMDGATGRMPTLVRSDISEIGKFARTGEQRKRHMKWSEQGGYWLVCHCINLCQQSQYWAPLKTTDYMPKQTEAHARIFSSWYPLHNTLFVPDTQQYTVWCGMTFRIPETSNILASCPHSLKLKITFNIYYYCCCLFSCYWPIFTTSNAGFHK